MKHKVPPLNSLRAFEACGRYLNVANAADELCVSPGAVSQQVKQLEHWLSQSLFFRSNRGLVFTDCGERYHREITEAFKIIAISTAAVTKPKVRKQLVISTTATFAMKWLLPKFEAFRDKWESVEIIIKTVDDIEVFNSDEADVGIRYGLGVYPDFHSSEIVRDELVVVASSNYIEDHNIINSSDLANCILISDQHPIIINNYPTWPEFFNYFNIAFSEPLKSRKFTQQWMVLQAAIAGEGIALVKKSLVDDDLKKGKLKIIFPQSLQLNTGYHLVFTNENLGDDVILSLERWLINKN